MIGQSRLVSNVMIPTERMIQREKGRCKEDTWLTKREKKLRERRGCRVRRKESEEEAEENSK